MKAVDPKNDLLKLLNTVYHTDTVKTEDANMILLVLVYPI